MTDTTYFSGSRAEAEAHLKTLGHLAEGWTTIAALPEEAKPLFANREGEGPHGPTRCKHQRVICPDGSDGTFTTCWTTFPDHIEEWSASTCDN